MSEFARLQGWDPIHLTRLKQVGHLALTEDDQRVCSVASICLRAVSRRDSRPALGAISTRVRSSRVLPGSVHCGSNGPRAISSSEPLTVFHSFACGLDAVFASRWTKCPAATQPQPCSRAIENHRRFASDRMAVSLIEALLPSYVAIACEIRCASHHLMGWRGTGERRIASGRFSDSVAGQR